MLEIFELPIKIVQLLLILMNGQRLALQLAYPLVDNVQDLLLVVGEEGEQVLEWILLGLGQRFG